MLREEPAFERALKLSKIVIHNSQLVDDAPQLVAIFWKRARSRMLNFALIARAANSRPGI